MKKWTYYNENNPEACEWLRELMRRRFISEGEIDGRSITAVRADEVRGFRRRHWFAGVGGWDLALQLAEYPDDRPVDTVSCPCQPFSGAGLGLGTKDSRHLFPTWRKLKARLDGADVFGEQVASADGREWLARVRLEMATLGYATRAADLCAASVGAPHIRQRLYWMADADGAGRYEGTRQLGEIEGPRRGQSEPSIDCIAPRLADTSEQRRAEFNALLWQETGGRIGAPPLPQAAGRGIAHGLADADGRQHWHGGVQPCGQQRQQSQDGIAGGLEHASRDGWEQWRPASGERSAVGGCAVDGMGDTHHQGPQGRGLRPDGDARQRPSWSANPAFIPCTDGKQRRSQSGLQPLVDGIPSRVGPVLSALRSLGSGPVKAARRNRIIRLHGYGNAIVPELAAEFIRACLDRRAEDPRDAI